MAAYEKPNYNQDGVYNEFDYTSTYTTNEKLDTSLFLKRAGDSMFGDLTAPSITLYDVNGSLEFADASEQTTAFTQAYIDKINNPGINTDHLTTLDITFADNSVQSTAFTNILKSKLSGNNTDLTNINYTSANNTTSISNNVYCESLTCGNINTSYLTTLTSNVQTQINNINIPTNLVTIDTAQSISGAKTFNTDVNTLGYIKQSGNHLLPIGTILMYAGANTPLLFISCMGQSYDRVLFAELFAVCGTTYGSTSATTFNIPDMRGLFVRGAGTNSITGSFGSMGQIQSSSIESHGHGFSSIDTDLGLSDSNALTGIDLINVLNGSLDKIFAKFTNPITKFINKTTSSMLNSSGNVVGTNSETRPTNIALNYIIKIR